jgi:hypothetical protein
MRFLFTHDLFLTFVFRTGSASPNGKMSIAALLLSMISSITSIVATIACSYVQIDGRLSDTQPYRSPAGDGKYGAGVGFFRYEDASFSFSSFFDDDYWSTSNGSFDNDDFWSTSNGSFDVTTCTTYSSDMMDNAPYFDGAFKAARAFAIMSNVCIGIGMLCLMSSCCVELPPKVVKSLGFLFGAGSLFQLLTFSVFASSVCNEFQCELSTGAFFAIVSMIFSFLTAIVTCKISPATDIGVPANTLALPEASPTTVTETVMPDGTKKIIETTVNADGSKTVSETVVRPEKV